MFQLPFVLAFLACAGHGRRLSSRQESPNNFTAKVLVADDRLSRLADILRAFNPVPLSSAACRSVVPAPAARRAGSTGGLYGMSNSMQKTRGSLSPGRSGLICMDIPPLVRVVLTTAAMGFLLWLNSKDAGTKTDADVTALAQTEEEMLQLHEFRCETCGYTLFPARGRENKFFIGNDDFSCVQCGAPKEAFFDMNDFSDPRTVEALQDDPDFEYEIVEVEIDDDGNVTASGAGDAEYDAEGDAGGEDVADTPQVIASLDLDAEEEGLGLVRKIPEEYQKLDPKPSINEWMNFDPLVNELLNNTLVLEPA